ncbi:MAG TPA: selenocysteine-specific translation elongation factor [Gemmatimonadaceae bacterium]|nr:selenocysteine-specific translation elongation factor [Gemmatimonadaceae bacterium]
MERRVIIGTAGHIDHGKTALVKALTGVDADRLPEEKRRGITIDLGFAPLELEGIGTVGIVDVPGHEDFVRSMLVGASGIDLGLLVVAADEGVMPQTREHLLILRLLGIPTILVALTKSDLANSEWIDLVRADVLSLFDQAGLPTPRVVSCSSRTGDGLAELRAILAKILSTATPRASDDVFRLPVDRAFTVKGTGTVVTGTVWSGQLRADENVRILPAGKHSRARRIEQHGKSSERALAGGRTAVALAGIDVAEVPRGSVLVTQESWSATSLFEAVVTIDSDAAIKLTSRTRLRLHAGASEVGARLVVAGGSLSFGKSTLARVITDAPVTLRGGDRFVLRLPAPLRTIGGGVVVDPYSRRRTLSHDTEANPAALATSSAARFTRMLEAEGLRGIATRDVPVRAGCAPAEVGALIAQSGARVGNHNLFAPAAVELVMATVRRIIAEYEISAPLAPGVPTQTLKEGLRANEELVDIAIREMQNAAEIETQGPLVRRTGWSPSPSTRDTAVSEQVAHDICASDREPPSVNELVLRYGSSVPALLRLLERQGRIVQVETDRYYDRSVLERMIARLKESLVPGNTYVPAQLRDILGFSRKYLIPFLEFCDRSGLTERRGDGRVLRQTPGVLLDTSRARS